jgi:hypothetical protein
MPRLRCPHCATLVGFDPASAGAVQPCPACAKPFRVPGAKPAAPPTPAHPAAVRPRAPATPAPPANPPPADDVIDLTSADAVEDDHDEPVLLKKVSGPDDADDRPRQRRRPRDDEDDDPPRRRRGRRRQARAREPGKPFSVIDLLPVDYLLQANIAAGVWLTCVVTFICFAVVAANHHSYPPLYTLLLWLIAFPAGVWACGAYAKYKGYHELIGLIGVTGCFGLLILFLLPFRD